MSFWSFIVPSFSLISGKQTQLLAKSLISDSISAEMSLTYNEKSKGPNAVPCGTRDETGTQSDFTPFTTCYCLKHRELSIHLIAEQFTFKESIRGCIKGLLKIQYECIHLSSFAIMSFPKNRFSVWYVNVHSDEPLCLNIQYVQVSYSYTSQMKETGR